MYGCAVVTGVGFAPPGAEESIERAQALPLARMTEGFPRPLRTNYVPRPAVLTAKAITSAAVIISPEHPRESKLTRG